MRAVLRATMPVTPLLAAGAGSGWHLRRVVSGLVVQQRVRWPLSDAMWVRLPGLAITRLVLRAGLLLAVQ